MTRQRQNLSSYENLDKIDDDEASGLIKQIAREEHELRQATAKEIISLFKISNIIVLSVIGFLFFIDILLVYSGKATIQERIITSEIIIALVGATTVQLGAVMYTYSQYIFNKT